MTGLGLDTLRAWERRYEAVVPGRTDRGRLYTDADVARLRRLAELVRRGHAIGTVAGLPDADLDRRIASTGVQPEVGPGPAVADLAPVIDALDRYDLDAIEAILNRHAVVLPARDLVFAVVVPLLQEIGRRWEAGTLRPSQEHLISAIIRSVLGGLLRVTSRPGAAPRIVLATLAGERHELGLLCAGLLAASAGHDVVYLGPDLPAVDIVHAATAAGAQVVMIAATTSAPVPRREVHKLLTLPPEVELWVGGPQAGAVAAIAGARARRIEGLDEVLPLLAARGL
jgi:MerR family transcriptional regulator, light-induced transcriptional regulator